MWITLFYYPHDHRFSIIIPSLFHRTITAFPSYRHRLSIPRARCLTLPVRHANHAFITHSFTTRCKIDRFATRNGPFRKTVLPERRYALSRTHRTSCVGRTPRVAAKHTPTAERVVKIKHLFLCIVLDLRYLCINYKTIILCRQGVIFRCLYTSKPRNMGTAQRSRSSISAARHGRMSHGTSSHNE